VVSDLLLLKDVVLWVVLDVVLLRDVVLGEVIEVVFNVVLWVVGAVLR
jgi:hypothetical protein